MIDYNAPRYEVIAEFPGGPKEGTVIQFEKVGDRYLCGEYTEEYFDDFPKVYKKLDWWERRSKMPQWIRHKDAGVVRDVEWEGLVAKSKSTIINDLRYWEPLSDAEFLIDAISKQLDFDGHDDCISWDLREGVLISQRQARAIVFFLSQ